MNASYSNAKRCSILKMHQVTKYWVGDRVVGLGQLADDPVEETREVAPAHLRLVVVARSAWSRPMMRAGAVGSRRPGDRAR